MKSAVRHYADRGFALVENGDMEELEKILNDNHDYYQLVKNRFGKSRFYKIGGNHDGYYSRELEGMIELEGRFEGFSHHHLWTQP